MTPISPSSMTLLGIIVATLIIFLVVLIYTINKRIKRRKDFYRYEEEELEREKLRIRGPPKSLESTCNSVTNSTHSTTLSHSCQKNSRPDSFVTFNDSISTLNQPNKIKLPNSETNSLDHRFGQRVSKYMNYTHDTHENCIKLNDSNSNSDSQNINAPALPSVPPIAVPHHRVLLRKTLTPIYKVPCNINRISKDFQYTCMGQNNVYPEHSQTLNNLNRSNINSSNINSNRPSTYINNHNDLSRLSGYDPVYCENSIVSITARDKSPSPTAYDNLYELDQRINCNDNNTNSIDSRMSIGGWFDETYGTLYKKYMRGSFSGGDNGQG